MLNKILNLDNAKSISKDAQKEINGGRIWDLRRCPGDGSSIIQNGVRVCCYIPSSGYYIC